MKTYEEIDQVLNNTINDIFKDEDLLSLTDYEIRQKIFNYLCDNLSYDYDLLQEIKNSTNSHLRIKRDPQKEFQSAVFDKVGICNAISQYYKLLLEKVGINACCVICDDGTDVKHQLNLVYDCDNDCYSFDDITSVIVNRGSREEFFDYDVDFANSINQGNKPILLDQCFVILWEEYIDLVAGRKSSPYQTLRELPNNVYSIKNCLSNTK